MSNPAPIVTVTGRLHAIREESVPAVEAQPEQRDEHGNVTRRAVAPRAAYDRHDLTVLTPEGGFIGLVLLDGALAELGGDLPTAGDEVEFACRPYVRWNRGSRGAFPAVGFSVAGDVTAARRKASAGRRLAPAAAAG